jgi:hypothetical protein
VADAQSPFRTLSPTSDPATSRPPAGAPEPGPVEPASGCLLRLFWMGVGNVAWLAAGLFVARSSGWTLADAGYLVCLVALIGARYLDVFRFKGQTADGTAATPAHFRRYAAMVVVLGLLGWVVARWVGPGF